MRPRRDRWLSLLEVAELIAKDRPRVAELSRKRRREYALRLVRRVERRDGERMSRRIGREWYVSRDRADALRKWEPESLDELSRAVSHLHANQREQKRQTNGHGAKLRDHDARLRTVEEKQKLADEYLTGLARLERRTTAA